EGTQLAHGLASRIGGTPIVGIPRIGRIRRTMTDASTHERQYDLSDAQRDLRDGIRDLVAEHVAPRAAAIDAAGEFPADVRDALAALDIFALPFDEEHGGTGTGAL